MKIQQVHIRNFTLKELEDWIEQIGEKRFRARQIFRQIFLRNVDSWDLCTDLSKKLRKKLNFLTTLNGIKLKERLLSSDGTEKFAFELPDGFHIESVLIPDPPRRTLCLSTQVGCPLSCKFCYTGTLGYVRNLTAGEIVEQYCQVQRVIGSKARITNVVFMGMGEPLLNETEVLRAIEILLDPLGPSFSHRRITISTAGIVPAMKRLGETHPVNIAVSLHAPNNELRSMLMPINKKYPLEELIKTCEEYPLPPRKRITFEYVLIDNINDSQEQAKELVELVKPIRCKINLIPFNPFPGTSYRRPSDEKIEQFKQILLDSNITATVRTSRGADILAACGQLTGAIKNGATRF